MTSLLEKLLAQLPSEVPLGLYECPYPYKRLVTLEELRFCAESGRFHFLKDTSCDIRLIRERLKQIRGTPLKLFNANTATLLESIEAGAAGFSGVMANFHAELYSWLWKNWSAYPMDAKRLQAGLTLCSQIEKQLYPVNAKYSLQLDGLPIGLQSRVQDAEQLGPLFRDEVRQLRLLADWMKQGLPAFS